MNRNILILLPALFFVTATAVAGDIVYLKNGKSFVAEETWEENGQIKCKRLGSVVGYQKNIVDRIEKGAAPDEPNIPGENYFEDEVESGRYSHAEESGSSENQRKWTDVFQGGRSGPMTIRDMMDQIQRVNIFLVIAFFLIPPVAVLLISRIHGKGSGGKSPWKYMYSILAYMVSVPGMLACVLTAYSVFFIRQNLLDVNVFVYFMPILIMIVTLVLIGRSVSWSHVPGVDRLYGMMIFLIISFGMALAIQKTRIFIFFGGRFSTLLWIAVICFILLKIAFWVIFRKKKKRFEI